MNSRHLALVCLSLACPALPCQHDDRVRRLDETMPGFIAERMVRGNLPGVCVVLVGDGKVVWERGFGRKNLAYPDPITTDSVFRVASLTKQFTAMALLMLQEAGVLDLDDPVVKHVPEFRTRDGRQDRITIRQMLSHHSGLPRGPYYASRHPSAHQQVLDLARMDLAYEPGETFKYSNTAYNLAGQVVARCSRTTYRGFMRQRILRPLGMRHSGFELSTELSGHYATGYQTEHYRPLVVSGEPLTAAPLVPAPDAAANLFASARDVTRFLMCLLCQGQLGGVRLISPASFKQMVTPFKPTGEAGVGYGLGLSNGRRFGRRVFSHTGGYFGHSALMIGFPEELAGGVVLINRASAHIENYRILDRALAIWFNQQPPKIAGDRKLAGVYTDGENSVEVVASRDDLYLIEEGITRPLEPFSDGRYLVSGGRFKEWPLDFRQRGRLYAGPHTLFSEGEPRDFAPSPWDRFCGTYRDDDFGEVVVFRRGLDLMFSFSRAEQVRLQPTGPTSFQITAGSFRGEPAEFLLERGRVVGLRAGYMDYRRGSF